MRSHKHKFVFGKHWQTLSLEQYEFNCRLLLQYHGRMCPPGVDWKNLKGRFNVSDATHYLMEDYVDREPPRPFKPLAMEKRVYAGTRRY